MPRALHRDSYFRLHATIETKAMLGVGAIALEGPATARASLMVTNPCRSLSATGKRGGCSTKSLLKRSWIVRSAFPATDTFS